MSEFGTDINVGNIDKFVDGFAEIFANIREKEIDDSVCGLCEYDGAYIGQSGDWFNECPGFDQDDCFRLKEKLRKKWTDEILAICRSVGNGSEIPNSSDCISRQVAINALMERFIRVPTNAIIAKDTIENLPSAQPEIIYCKDCCWNDGTCYCEFHYRDIKPTDYCSWSERRTDEC